jgi:crotonobetainyl-CoA:carnitine CoA-transferase CaiB-like acyl-CoA transferase
VNATPAPELNRASLPLQGIHVVEVASGEFVPATGALLAEWGADVVKVQGIADADTATPPIEATAMLWRQLNRGKRSITIDAQANEGYDILARLVERADVFLTDLPSGASGGLGIDVDDVRARNPRAIYARGTSFGPRGPERDRIGSDYTTYWSRGGLSTTFQLVDPSLVRPAEEPSQGFGEFPTAAILAGGIAAAVYRRTVSGEASVVDASLLGYAAFNLSMDVVSVSAGVGTMTGTVALPPDRFSVTNPLTNPFRTKDGRFITLCVMQEHLFPEVCTQLGRDDLNADERFATPEQRRQHGPDFVRALDDTFATRTFDEWKSVLTDTRWVWEPVQSVDELMVDAQVTANEYVRPLDDELPLVVSGPVQFDERPPPLRVAPTPGEHTDAVLAELGFDAAQLDELRRAGTIG